MLVIAWQYLTGRSVATDFADRQAAEWPPHPDRVFQALVAAWGERGRAPDERVALEWLERQGPPQLAMPEPMDKPEPMKVFVPVNDLDAPTRGSYVEKQLGLMPAYRPRKERYFPSSYVGEESVCALVWVGAEAAPHSAALGRLCAAVNRIGHSSSLVRCWLGGQHPPVSMIPRENGRRKGLMLRVPGPGRLEALCLNHQNSLNQKKYLAPAWAAQQAYVRVAGNAEPPRGHFAASVAVFTQVAGQRYSLAQAPLLCETFRKTLIAQAKPEVRALISGHADDGQPLQRPHLAYLPLGFVGHDHADGHVLGLALAFPKDVSVDQEDGVYEAIGKASDIQGNLKLVMGSVGDLTLSSDEQSVAPQALRSETWCAPSRQWATVTPMALDRRQNRRRSNPALWDAEQAAAACDWQGLPAPLDVRVGPVSRFKGAPSVYDMVLKRKDGTRCRMIHAVFEFPEAVSGPLVLGAGRYRGYGLCKPVTA